MPAVEIEHADGTTETIPAVIGATETRAYGEMAKLTVEVTRDDAQGVTLEPKRDLVTYNGETYRLVNIQPATDTWALECYSREWDAKRIEPYPGGTQRQGTDKELIEGIIADVPEWSVGTVQELTGPMTFVFNHAYKHEALREIEGKVPGALSFEGDGTVNYEAPPSEPSDPTTVPEISAGTIDGSLTIDDIGIDIDGTHVRVLGAHEGEAQYFAQLVPAADPDSYANDVRYSTPRWTDEADTDWDRWENKEVTNQQTIEEEAESLAAELDKDHYQVRTTEGVEPSELDAGVTLERGDWVRAVKASSDFDELLRIHRVKRVRNGSTARIQLTMSTRQILFNEGTKAYDDIQKFNVGYQGSSVSVQGGGSRQPVDNGLPAQIPFDYPNIEFENEVTLQLRGLPYRSYSSGASNNPPFSTVVEESGGGSLQTIDSGDISSSDPWVTVANFDPPGGGETQQAEFLNSLYIRQTDVPGTTNMNVRLSFNFGNEGYYPDQDGAQILEFGNDHIPLRRLWSPTLSGDLNALAQVELQVTVPLFESANQGDLFVEVSAFSAVDFTGTHGHPPDPGIVEQYPNDPDAIGGQLLPSGVDVLANGSTVATDVASGAFETEVDLSGELTPGAWNLIELTSDTLGHIQGTISLDGYKQIGRQ